MRNYILIYIATPITLLGKPLQTSLVRIFLKLTTLEFLYDYIITFIHHKGSKKRIRWWLDVRPPHMQQHYIATCNPSDGLLIVSHSGSVVTHYQAILFAVVTARAITIILKLSKIICKAPKSYRYTKKLPTNKTFFVRRDLQSAEIGWASQGNYLEFITTVYRLSRSFMFEYCTALEIFPRHLAKKSMVLGVVVVLYFGHLTLV